MMAAGRVLCVTVTSATGHVIIERFYEALPERAQMEWRARLHEASEASIAVGGRAALGEQEADRVSEACGTARHGDDNVVWVRVGDVCFFAVGDGEYDELARELPAKVARPQKRPTSAHLVLACHLLCQPEERER
jgi:hypothetical protein